jgi:hypothetical protein
MTGLDHELLPRKQDVLAGIQDSPHLVLFVYVVEFLREKSENLETYLSDGVPLALEAAQEQFEHFEIVEAEILQDVSAD